RPFALRDLRQQAQAEFRGDGLDNVDRGLAQGPAARPVQVSVAGKGNITTRPDAVADLCSYCRLKLERFGFGFGEELADGRKSSTLSNADRASCSADRSDHVPEAASLACLERHDRSPSLARLSASRNASN